MVMGIYDRDYYRREGPSFLETFARQGQVCKGLIVANVIAYILQFLTRQQVAMDGFALPVWTEPFTDFFLLDPDKVWSGEVWRLLTHAFLHSTASPLHILFNMLFLWWFGQDLEERLGHKEFLAFYLVAAVAGGVAYVLGARLDPIHLGGRALGASGAVTAVMVVFAFYQPHYVVLLFFVLPIPVWVLVAFQVGKDVLAFLGRAPNGVGIMAHLGGAAFGALYYTFHWRILNLWPNFRFRQRQRARPRLRVYREEAETPHPVPVAAAPASDVDEQLEAKLDAVLAKVARSGQASLSEGEKQILLRASEVYKKRRS
jgi:membrane associated rhomboid family serine protease